jgi:hypothetical protein
VGKGKRYQLMGKPLSEEQKLKNQIASLRSSAIAKDNELKASRRQEATYEKIIGDYSRQLEIFTTIKDAAKNRTPIIAKKPRKTNKGEQAWQGTNEPWHMTVMLLSSDWQLGEVVAANNVHGVNAYDQAIAIMRVKAWIEDSIKMIKHQTQGSVIDKVVIGFLGDEISGNLHLELMKTNDGTPLENVLLSIDLKKYVILRLLEEGWLVDAVQVPSNHCRTSVQNEHKKQAQNDYGWFGSKILQDDFKDDDRVNLYVSDAYDAQVKIYDEVVNLEHGHMGTGGGGGIQGIGPGMTRATMKRERRDRALGRPATKYVYGHFHTPIAEGDYIVNGSVIGVSEYPYNGAMDLKYGGKPVQWVMYFTPELGYTHSYPIVCLADGEKKLWKTAGRNSWSREDI